MIMDHCIENDYGLVHCIANDYGFLLAEPDAYIYIICEQINSNLSKLLVFLIYIYQYAFLVLVGSTDSRIPLKIDNNPFLFSLRMKQLLTTSFSSEKKCSYVTNSQKGIESSQLADHLVNEINQGPHVLFTSVSGLCHPGSHHFLLKKVKSDLIRQLEHNDSNLITLLYSLSIFQIIKFESLCSSCLIKF